MNSVLPLIKEYLGNGGFFNPELMDHQKVRNMVVQARDEIERLRAWHRETLSECAQENADGEPFDTFNEIASNALFTDETPESVCKAALEGRGQKDGA